MFLVIKGADVKFIQIPQYYGLSIKDIKTFLVDYPQVYLFLPDEIELPKVPK